VVTDREMRTRSQLANLGSTGASPVEALQRLRGCGSAAPPWRSNVVVHETTVLTRKSEGYTPAIAFVGRLFRRRRRVFRRGC
jgi:hypothetical protein